MPINFPNAPTLDQEYSFNNRTWKWDGTKWSPLGEVPPVISVSGKQGEVTLEKADVGLDNVDNVSAADLRNRGTHTGTQVASTISDFETAVAATAAVTANTAKVTNATHTGDVTGDTALTIANNAVTNAKTADMAVNTIKGRITAGTGDSEDLTAANVRTIINVADGANNYIHPASHPPSIITQDADNRFVTDAEKTAWNAKVPRTSTTGSAVIPTGTEAQRDVTPAAGYLRFNTATNSFEGYDGTEWTAVGGGPDAGIFFENDIIVSSNYTITEGRNAGTFGPITVADGVNVTVPLGSVWTVV